MRSSPIQDSILSAVEKNPGIHHLDLKREVFGKCTVSESLLTVHISSLNKKLASRGLRVRGRSKPRGGYSVWLGYPKVELEQVQSIETNGRTT